MNILNFSKNIYAEQVYQKEYCDPALTVMSQPSEQIE